MGRRTKLTLEVHMLVVQSIRAGSFDYVAAQAAGIGYRTFRRWMKGGEARADSPYRQFWQDVQGARAEARVAAENRVFKDAPFNWLRYGPGRERPGEPGWTDSKQIEVSGPGGAPFSITHRFAEALKRAYDSTGQISEDGGEGELPAGPDRELPAG